MKRFLLALISCAASYACAADPIPSLEDWKKISERSQVKRSEGADLTGRGQITLRPTATSAWKPAYAILTQEFHSGKKLGSMTLGSLPKKDVTEYLCSVGVGSAKSARPPETSPQGVFPLGRLEWVHNRIVLDSGAVKEMTSYILSFGDLQGFTGSLSCTAPGWRNAPDLAEFQSLLTQTGASSVVGLSLPKNVSWTANPEVDLQKMLSKP